MDAALDRRTRTGLSLLAFQAVGREGLETVVFLLAIAFSASGRHVLVGGAGGLVVALGIAFVIYRLGHRLKLTRFFRTVGVLLMVFAAGLLVDAVQNMQQLGWIPWMSHPVWNTGRWLSEDSAFGDVLHSFFGYAARPSILQVTIYAVYVVAVVSFFLGRPRPLPVRSRPQSMATGGEVRGPGQ
jgi:high-affinity iron transporter